MHIHTHTQQETSTGGRQNTELCSPRWNTSQLGVNQAVAKILMGKKKKKKRQREAARETGTATDKKDRGLLEEIKNSMLCSS